MASAALRAAALRRRQPGHAGGQAGADAAGAARARRGAGLRAGPGVRVPGVVRLAQPDDVPDPVLLGEPRPLPADDDRLPDAGLAGVHRDLHAVRHRLDPGHPDQHRGGLRVTFPVRATLAPEGRMTMASRAGTGVLLGGLGLVAAYAVTAVVFGGFSLPTGADYVTLREALRQVGVDQVLIRDLAPHAAVAGVARLVLLLPAAVLLALWLAPRWPARTLATAARLLEAPRHRAALVAITLATAGLLVVWARWVFGGQPVFDDEFTYLFQARTLASGWLAAPAPPCPPCFENVFIIIRDGLWVGKYTSGHPALVALSLLLGSPYVLPLLLAALVPLLVHQIARETDGAPIGLIAAGLLVISPLFLMTAATLMNHGTNLFFLALFVLAYLRARRGRAWIWAIVAGLAIGIALNIRPQTAVAVGLPFGVWPLARLRGD
ncbi:phospholipid carrier-dependent glycosyltransferase, partial [bacterium]|nr:phospholipid carrier-dependent glycosyltransferase [bacterium]